MKLQDNLKNRIAYLLDLVEVVLSTEIYSNTQSKYREVDEVKFVELRSSALSFILSLYGGKHPYFISFHSRVTANKVYNVDYAKGYLTAIKAEIENGWLNNIKGLVSAEIFTDFLEMAEHLLEEKYKDPAAVIIGSVLEEQLRRLCVKNTIDIEENKSGKLVPKKANTLNDELAKGNVYNKLDQKSVTSWLDLRNKAAHGKYDEYTIEQVKIMYSGVLDFITRNSI